MIQVHQWDPFGRALKLEALERFRGRYTFTKFPTRLEDIDPAKGIELNEGKFGEIRIDRITVFQNGIIIDTRSSTEDSEKVLDDIIALANEAFGAVIHPVRKGFTSQFIFQSNMRMLALHPIVPKIAETLTSHASADFKHPFTFEPSALLFNVDLSQAKTAPAVFSIERRAEIPFAENTYFSNAPLRTAEHIEVIKQFETAMLNTDSQPPR